MLDLALNASRDHPVSLKGVSERQGISLKYLEQLVIPLVGAGFVKSVRGPQGGYLLAQAPENYTAGAILRLMEGNLVSLFCIDGGPETCARYDGCAALELWRRIGEAVDKVVDTTTLADLMRIHREKNPSGKKYCGNCSRQI